MCINHKITMKMLTWAPVVMVTLMIFVVSSATHNCNYTAIYAFGDSNTDTGGIFAAFYPPLLPYGQTFFHRPGGRASDGRLIIDFIAEKLGKPYLSPYLDSIASNYREGANFATGGATIQRPKSSWFDTGLSPFNLEIQVEHFLQLKDRSAFYYQQQQQSGGGGGRENINNNDEIVKRLAKPEELGDALMVIDIGQNDIAASIDVAALLPLLTSRIQTLYWNGGRRFWIHNTGPKGCLPQVASKAAGAGKVVDEYGCVQDLNNIAMEFNRQLKSEVAKLRQQLPGAAIVYVDIYSAKYHLISNAKNLGFESGMSICCGYHGAGYDIWCGNTGDLNGTKVHADSCKNPGQVISWDGVHYTEAANRWIANRIEDGSFSDPPIPLKGACRVDMDMT